MIETDYQIPNAVAMANEKAEKRNWTAAFMVAMNWLLYKRGERVLSKHEIKEAEDMYGPIDGGPG